MTKAIYFTIILFCCGFASGQRAFEVNQLDQLKNEYKIDKNIYIFEDSSCQSFSETSLPKAISNQLVEYDSTAVIRSEYCYWLHFRLKSGSNFKHYFKDWKLFIGEANYASVYIYDKSHQLVEKKDFGKWYPKSKKSDKLNHKKQRVSISFDPSEELSFYIKYQKRDHHDHIFEISLNKFDFYQTSAFLYSTWQDWLFIGFLLTIIMLNLLFFYSTGYHAYMYHGLFILGIFLFILDLYLVTINLPIIDEFPIMVQFVDMLGIGLADVAYFQFVRHYLNLKQKLPTWDALLQKIVLIKLIFYPALIGFYYTTLNEPLTDKILLVFLLIEYSIILYFLMIKLKPKDKAAFYLIIGSFFLLLLLLIDTLSLFSSIGISKSLTQIGMLGEILAFSFGLSYRFNQLKEEEEQAEKIKELSEFKSHLLTNITHEFRTPLTVIQGISELFQNSRENNSSPSELKNGYDTIARNSQNLLNLVNQMLDLAKLESKNLHLNLRNKDLVNISKEAVQGLLPQAQKKSISLTFHSSLHSLGMDIDDQKMYTILVNLISNAIKFTPVYGQIKVSLDMLKMEDRSVARIIIADTGIGIDKKDIPYIFDRFFQTSSNTSGDVGTGIGLSLVNELIKLMHGTISVESELNNGTVFTLEIPISNALKSTKSDEENKESTSTAVLKDAFDILDQKPLLLIVEDNLDIVEYLTVILSDEYELVKAFDGIEGLEKANTLIPDLIISDLMMPKMDGLKLCEALKTGEKTNHIPIIILTAKSSFEHKLEGLNTGADAYLTKPFRKEELYIRLKKLNESRHILQEKFSKFSLIEDPKKLKTENTFLHNVHSIIEENITNSDFNVEELARQMHMSRMQLHRKLKAVSDRSTSNYIRSYRLYKSKPMLSDQNITISEIAWAVGFQNLNYYSKSFQKEFDLTPSEYRLQLKNK